MKKRFLYLTTLAVSVTVLVLAVTQTVAWLVKQSENNGEIVISDVEIDGVACFADSESADNTISMSDFLTALNEEGNSFSSGENITVNLVDPQSANYYANLRFAVKLSGASPMLVRVRIIEQVEENNEFIFSHFIRYTVPESDIAFTQDGTVPSINLDYPDGEWYDNRLLDFCYYYTVPIYPAQVENNINDTYLYLINGISPDNMALVSGSDETSVNLLIQVEAVQPNRYREFWKMSNLPWETVTP